MAGLPDFGKVLGSMTPAGVGQLFRGVDMGKAIKFAETHKLEGFGALVLAARAVQVAEAAEKGVSPPPVGFLAKTALSAAAAELVFQNAKRLSTNPAVDAVLAAATFVLGEIEGGRLIELIDAAETNTIDAIKGAREKREPVAPVGGPGDLTV